jgi:hypothetical protein
MKRNLILEPEVFLNDDLCDIIYFDSDTWEEKVEQFRSILTLLQTNSYYYKHVTNKLTTTYLINLFTTISEQYMRPHKNVIRMFTFHNPIFKIALIGPPYKDVIVQHFATYINSTLFMTLLWFPYKKDINNNVYEFEYINFYGSYLSTYSQILCINMLVGDIENYNFTAFCDEIEKNMLEAQEEKD